MLSCPAELTTSAACPRTPLPLYWAQHPGALECGNQLYWSLDVAMREDAAQPYKNQGPRNQSLLQRIALQLLKCDSPAKVACRLRIYP